VLWRSDRNAGVSLNLLTEQDVTTYVAGQFPEQLMPEQLAHAIYRRTEGNPLFMVNVINAFTEQELRSTGNGRWDSPLNSQPLVIPENLQQTIAQRVARLDPNERSILEAASVAGIEFTAAVVAAAVRKKPIEVEERFGELARRKQFIQVKGTIEWPDGTVTERYGFIHTLYQEALYERVTGGKRVELHQRIGECIEQGYSNRRQEVAAELALHFEQGRDFHRTVQYLGHAAENANQRCAYPEATRHLGKALDLLKTLPDDTERAQQEIMLQIALGTSLMATKGYAAPEVKSAYDRARELCLQVGETPQLVLILRGLSTFYYVRAELQIAKAIAEQIVDLVHSQQDRILLLQASYGMGGTLFNLGEFPAAYHHLQQAMLFSDSHKPQSHTLLSGQDTEIYCLTRMSYSLWFLGYPDQALVRMQEALSLSQGLALPHGLAYALTFAAGLHLFCQEDQVAQQCAEKARGFATEHEFPIWATMGQILDGSALVHQGMVEQGRHQIQDGMATWRAIGAQISVPYFLSLLAEAYEKSGQPEKGIRMLTEALALTNNTEERWWEAELYRLKGTLTLEARDWRLKTHPFSQAPNLKPQVPSEVAREAEECFLKALEVAQRQQAKSLELRAAASLARLKQRQRKPDEAFSILEEVYNWFTEGFGTADLQDAKLLLNELREQRMSGHFATLRTTKTKRKSSGTSQPTAEPRVAQSARR
jgi:predicted ATPase